MESLSDYILSLGTGGIFCILVLKVVFEYLKTRKEKDEKKDSKTVISRSDFSELRNAIESLRADINRDSVRILEIKQHVEKMLSLIYDLHRWHDVNDPNHPGAKLWWASSLRDLASSVNGLEESVKRIESIVRRRGD